MFFLERKLGVLVFSSLFMWGGISPVENGNLKGRDTKNGFPFAGSHLPCREFIWSEDFPFPFFHWPKIILFASALFHFHFPSTFDRESFLFFFIVLFFIFMFSFSFFPFIPFLSLGIRVLTFVIRSPLRRFCVLLFGGKGEDSLHRPRFKVA